jgi:hypothetical protein
LLMDVNYGGKLISMYIQTQILMCIIHTGNVEAQSDVEYAFVFCFQFTFVWRKLLL